MDMRDECMDVFRTGGTLKTELFCPSSLAALERSLVIARETQWDNLRSPHIFMGLIAEPDSGVRHWGVELHADLPRLLEQFQELFHQDRGDCEPLLRLHREFLSDNAIRVLRDAMNRARERSRPVITPMDLLIALLTSAQSIVAECFARIGLTAARLTELAVIAEHSASAS